MSGNFFVALALAHGTQNFFFTFTLPCGIHYRSTDQSTLLGEAVALRVLQDRASTYNEKFSITITKFDGTAAIKSSSRPSGRSLLRPEARVARSVRFAEADGSAVIFRIQVSLFFLFYLQLKTYD